MLHWIGLDCIGLDCIALDCTFEGGVDFIFILIDINIEIGTLLIYFQSKFILLSNLKNSPSSPSLYLLPRF
jgi:hypothetical protein